MLYIEICQEVIQLTCLTGTNIVKYHKCLYMNKRCNINIMYQLYSLKCSGSILRLNNLLLSNMPSLSNLKSKILFFVKPLNHFFKKHSCGSNVSLLNRVQFSSFPCVILKIFESNNKTLCTWNLQIRNMSRGHSNDMFNWNYYN